MGKVPKDRVHRTFYALPLGYELPRAIRSKGAENIAAKIQSGLVNSGWWDSSSKQQVYSAPLTPHARNLMGLELAEDVEPSARNEPKNGLSARVRRRGGRDKNGDNALKLETRYFEISDYGWESIFLTANQADRVMEVVTGRGGRLRDEPGGAAEGHTRGKVKLHNIELVVFATGVMILMLEVEVLEAAGMPPDQLLRILNDLRLLEPRALKKRTSLVRRGRRFKKQGRVNNSGLTPGLDAINKLSSGKSAISDVLKVLAWRNSEIVGEQGAVQTRGLYELSCPGFTIRDLMKTLQTVLEIFTGISLTQMLGRHLLGYSVYVFDKQPGYSLEQFVFRLSRLYRETYVPSPDLCRLLNNPFLYRPFEGVYHSFSLEGGCTVLIGDQMRRILWDKTRTSYLAPFIFAVYQRFTLLGFADSMARLAGILSDYRIDENELDRVRWRRLLVAEFHLSTPWTVISNISMYNHVYEHWLEAFKINSLLEEVRGKVERLDDYIHMERQRKMDRLGLILLPIIVGSGLLGMSFFERINIWISYGVGLGLLAVWAMIYLYRKKMR